MLTDARHVAGPHLQVVLVNHDGRVRVIIVSPQFLQVQGLHHATHDDVVDLEIVVVSGLHLSHHLEDHFAELSVIGLAIELLRLAVRFWEYPLHRVHDGAVKEEGRQFLLDPLHNGLPRERPVFVDVDVNPVLQQQSVPPHLEPEVVAEELNRLPSGALFGLARVPGCHKVIL